MGTLMLVKPAGRTPSPTPHARRLVMRAELMLLWGVGRTRAVVLSNGDDFPRPVSRVMAGSIWDLAEVLEWSAQKNRPVHLDALDAAAVAVDEG